MERLLANTSAHRQDPQRHAKCPHLHFPRYQVQVMHLPSHVHTFSSVQHSWQKTYSKDFSPSARSTEACKRSAFAFSEVQGASHAFPQPGPCTLWHSIHRTTTSLQTPRPIGKVCGDMQDVCACILSNTRCKPCIFPARSKHIPVFGIQGNTHLSKTLASFQVPQRYARHWSMHFPKSSQTYLVIPASDC